MAKWGVHVEEFKGKIDGVIAYRNTQKSPRVNPQCGGWRITLPTRAGLCTRYCSRLSPSVVTKPVSGSKPRISTPNPQSLDHALVTSRKLKTFHRPISWFVLGSEILRTTHLRQKSYSLESDCTASCIGHRRLLRHLGMAVENHGPLANERPVWMVLKKIVPRSSSMDKSPRDNEPRRDS